MIEIEDDSSHRSQNLGRHSFSRDADEEEEPPVQPIILPKSLIEDPSDSGILTPSKLRQRQEKSIILENIEQLRSEFEIQTKKYTEQMNEINSQIEQIHIENENIHQVQNDLDDKIEQNKKEINKLESDMSELSENQNVIAESVENMRKQLKNNLFKPVAVGMAFLFSSATVLLVLARSLVAIPTLLLAILFITAIRVSN